MNSWLHWMALWIIIAGIVTPFVGQFIAFGMGTDNKKIPRVCHHGYERGHCPRSIDCNVLQDDG